MRGMGVREASWPAAAPPGGSGLFDAFTLRPYIIQSVPGDVSVRAKSRPVFRGDERAGCGRKVYRETQVDCRAETEKAVQVI